MSHRLMVTSKDGDSVRGANLEADKKSYRLDGVIPTINVVTHEQVVVLRQVSANIKQLNQIKDNNVKLYKKSNITSY